MGVINLSLDPGLGAEVAHLGAIGHGAEVGGRCWRGRQRGADVARFRRHEVWPRLLATSVPRR